MRRDYFICIFLLCICASLFFVCFLPLFYEYNLIVPREFSMLEMVMSWLFAVSVLIIVPVYSAIKKKFWFTAGLAVYGLFANLPEWILPKLMEKLSGEDVSIISVIGNFIWRAIYGMVKAPFAGISPALGVDFARGLSNWILPVSLASYILVQLFRFYRDAYVADQLDPSRVMDSTAAENNGASVASRRRETREAEILGTQISAPVKAGSVRNPGEQQVVASQVFPVNPNNKAGVRSASKPAVSDATQKVPQVGANMASKPVNSDTQVIHLGPPKTDK